MIAAPETAGRHAVAAEATAPATLALETRALSRRFGALVVANEVEFQLAPGARHALIGPNGAGKTTFVNLVTGRLTPSSGRILLNGDDVTALSQAGRVRRGLARTFQINTLFRGLSVLENVALGVSERCGIAGGMFRLAGARRHVVEQAYTLLARLRVADDALRPVRELPYGKQRLVELAIALGLQPSVLLLDEPAAGIPSSETRIILDVIEQLPDSMAVLIIEHDMELVFRFARRITVLVQGGILVEGTPAEIAADPRVREVYLGDRHG
jgi:ABC-type branched-subunit amino acid transport system ATPase component